MKLNGLKTKKLVFGFVASVASVASLLSIYIKNNGIEFLLSVLPPGYSDMVGLFILEGRWVIWVSISVFIVFLGGGYRELTLAILISCLFLSIFTGQQELVDGEWIYWLGRLVTNAILIAIPTILFATLLIALKNLADKESK